MHSCVLVTALVRDTTRVHACTSAVIAHADRSRVVRTSLSSHRHQYLSPTAVPPGKLLVQQGHMKVVSAPLSLRVAYPGASQAIYAAKANAVDMFKESIYYPLAVAFLPSFAEHFGEPTGDMTAEALFGKEVSKTVHATFPLECKPELHVRGKAEKGKYGPAFNGEGKSATRPLLEQLTLYVVMDMVRIFFPATKTRDGDYESGSRRYFYKPPVGYGLLFVGHVGYYVAVEWVGKFFVSIVTQPFILGSDEHKTAATLLEDVEYEPPMELPTIDWFTTPQGARDHNAVYWGVHGDTFYKLMHHSARSADKMESMYRVYALLAELSADTSMPAAVVRGCRLMYGTHEVLVKMPAVKGTHPDDEDCVKEGTILNAITAAIVWLALHRIVYVDVRGPNVFVDGDTVVLVDYDDCIVVSKPITSLAGYIAALQGLPEGWASTFSELMCNADQLHNVKAALTAAFEASRA